MTGFNCLSEMRCIPQEYVCDGVPDCVILDTSLEELNGCGNYYGLATYEQYACMYSVADLEGFQWIPLKPPLYQTIVIESKICHFSRSQYEPGETLGFQWNPVSTTGITTIVLWKLHAHVRTM